MVRKGDLVLSNRPDDVIAVLDGKRPQCRGSPRRIALLKARDGFQPVAAGFRDIAELPAMPPEAVQLGLDGLKQIEFQWGFQDDALVTCSVWSPPSRAGHPGSARSALIHDPVATPLPAGLTGFTVLSIDLGKTYDQIVALVKKANPQAADGFRPFEDVIRQRFGLDLRNDLLANLGPKLSFYAHATRRGCGGQSGDGDDRPVHRV